jgi:hypothetical protein
MTRAEQPGLWFRLKRFVRRLPVFERRWITDDAAREAHDEVVRKRARAATPGHSKASASGGRRRR